MLCELCTASSECPISLSAAQVTLRKDRVAHVSQPSLTGEQVVTCFMFNSISYGYLISYRVKYRDSTFQFSMLMMLCNGKRYSTSPQNGKKACGEA